MDCWEISRFNRVPNYSELFKTELALGYSFLSDLRQEHLETKIIYVEGNHDYRIKSYIIRNAPALYDADFLPNYLRLKELNIKWIGTQEGSNKWTDTYFITEDLVIGHFDTVANPVIPAGMTVRNIMQKKVKKNSVVQAHVHRAAVIWDINEEGEKRFGLETPCLCKPPYYSGYSNWQRGLSFIDRTEDGWKPRLIIF